MNNKATKQRSKNTKAAGLKSTFIIEDQILMTSFGKGNNAILEKEIQGATVTSLNPKEKFSVSVTNDNEYRIEGNGKKAAAQLKNYAPKPIGMDLIGCKDVLEQLYFCKTFSDNIHIQLIYNIMDIEKILSVHINNIVYAIDNLQRVEDTEVDDFIGGFSVHDTYSKFANHPDPRIQKKHQQFIAYTNNARLMYFSGAPYSRDAATKKPQIDKEKLYYMFALLGDVRQFCAHSKKSLRDRLYTYEYFLPPEIKYMLNNLYDSKVSEINRGYSKNNERNMELLCRIMQITDRHQKEELAKDFYNFTIRKEYKNIGFSLKKLREALISSCWKEVLSTDYDSVRRKFYQLLDFIIYSYYKKNPQLIEANTAALRCNNQDKDKELFYQKEACRLWQEISPVCKQLQQKMNGKTIATLTVDPSIKALLNKAVNSVGLQTNTNLFCKVIYLMTLFLDGKEINDLLTTLINKFENIASFLYVMKRQNIACEFNSNPGTNFQMFSEAQQIARDLRAINSFARMVGVSNKAKRVLYQEAAELLGFDGNDEEMLQYLDEKMLDKARTHGKKDFRNFIAGNVIESSRFQYLVRYVNPKKMRAAANNRQIILFVLNSLPKEQIDRYYKSCCGNNSQESHAIKVDKLTDVIVNMNITNFETVVQHNRSQTSDTLRKKAKMQAVLSLYLTVLYLLAKNLVYVNSRYFLAFHCCERDMWLHQLKGNASAKAPRGVQWCSLTEAMLEKRQTEAEAKFALIDSPTGNHKKRLYEVKRSCAYLWDDMKQINNEIITVYRNHVMHLAALRNIDEFIGNAKNFQSYFELYHYLVQSSLITHWTEPLPEALQTTQHFLMQTGFYNKDLTKALNTPFGYNLPRFKNLTIEALFDKNQQQNQEQ